MNEQIKIRTCKKCEEEFEYNDLDVQWDESGYGYSTKYVICPLCGGYNVLKYKEDRGLHVNKDMRYYRYK